ncbi:uncharacterized protein TNCV_3841061 [Trichonephila clavipes]|nr:uncharacterized protein TNCV_3841061 [Trichonephila clavipes]
MPKFEGPYRVLEVRNNNLIIWKKRRRVTVNIDQVQVYPLRHSDTVVLIVLMRYYMKERDLVMDRVGRTRKNPEVLRNPRVMKARVGSEHRDRKRQTPVLPQGIKRTVSSSVASRTHKYRRNNFKPSHGPESIAGPSHQQKTRQLSPPIEDSRRGARVQSDKARETRTTRSKRHSAAEGRPVRSGQTTAVRPCPYYLRSHLKEPEGIPEVQSSTGIDSLPQNSLRRKSLSKEALDGDPTHRSA